MGKGARSAAAVLRALPVTTFLESAAVLLDSLETAANTVSALLQERFCVPISLLLNPIESHDIKK